MLRVLGISHDDIPQTLHWTAMFPSDSDFNAIQQRMKESLGAMPDDTEETLHDLLALSPTDFDSDKKEEAERRVCLDFPVVIEKDMESVLESCLKQVGMSTKEMRSKLIETGTSEHGYFPAGFHNPNLNLSAPPTTYVILEFPLKTSRVAAAKSISSAPMTYKDVPVKVIRIRPNFEYERDKLLHEWAEGYAER